MKHRFTLRERTLGLKEYCRTRPGWKLRGRVNEIMGRNFKMTGYRFWMDCSQFEHGRMK